MPCDGTPGCLSAFWRIGIPAVAVALADPAVAAMHEQFALLVPRDASGLRDGLRLRGMNRGRSAVAGALDCPPASARHNVLILAGHLMNF